MITVQILINDQVIFVRSARNQSEINESGETKYIVDDNKVIWHKRKDGAKELAKKMLDNINFEME